jgi:hypothetical protein
LLLAQITNGEKGDLRPFGSVFWHHSARCTRNIKLASPSSDGDCLQLAAFSRKSNLGPLRAAIGIEGSSIASGRTSLVSMTPRSTSWQRACSSGNASEAS